MPLLCHRVQSCCAQLCAVKGSWATMKCCHKVPLWHGKNVIPMGVAEHWKQSQRCDRSIHIDPQVDEAQDLNVYHRLCPVWKTFWQSNLHILFSAKILSFWIILLQSLVPIPHIKVHSGSLYDRSHVFTTRWLRSVLTLLSENYSFFSGFFSWWLHLESHSDSQSSWILVYFPTCGLKPWAGIQTLQHKELMVIKRGDFELTDVFFTNVNLPFTSNYSS